MVQGVCSKPIKIRHAGRISSARSLSLYPAISKANLFWRGDDIRLVLLGKEGPSTGPALGLVLRRHRARDPPCQIWLPLTISYNIFGVCKPYIEQGEGEGEGDKDKYEDEREGDGLVHAPPQTTGLPTGTLNLQYKLIPFFSTRRIAYKKCARMKAHELEYI